MFVILRKKKTCLIFIIFVFQCLDNIKQKHKNLTIPERIGEGLRSSGVSISVTSFTDMLAFAIGSSTVS